MFNRIKYMKEYHKKWYLENKEKAIKKNNEYRKLNKEKVKINSQNYHLKRTFGITIDQYNDMLKKQNGVCAICKQKELSNDSTGNIRKLSVDHNHKTGKIRGLLCVNCNHAIGNFKDNITILNSAITYLTKE